jgi:hypothetical protein
MFLYIMKNQGMPGLYKIGFSSDPVLRATGLSSATGVPLPFEIVHFVDCVTERQARRAEDMAHFIIEYSRVSESREFFSLEHENIGVQAIIVAAFCAWRPDRSAGEWQELVAELAKWPFDRSAT